MDQKHIKKTIYIRPDTEQAIEELYRSDHCSTQSEFIEKCINYYTGYIRADRNMNFLSPTPVVDTMTLDKGILACQKENYHWDCGLRKRYRRLAVFIIAIFVGIILILGIVKNEPIQDLVARLMIILPMAKWLVSIIAGLNEDIERLKELDNEFDQTKNKTMSELQMIQKSITEHRKAAVKIPNAVYRMFKDNDEDREHRIATMDAELK